MQIRYSTIILIATIGMFTSCNHHPKAIVNSLPENSKAITLKLVDSLGIVTFAIPNRYDTFFQWTDWSDCGKPCAEIEYRYQSKRFPIFLESGFMHDYLKDSVDEFTIEHAADLYYRDGRFGRGTFDRILNNHKYGIDELRKMEGYQVKFDTVEKINDRYFSIIMYEHYDSTQSEFVKSASAETTIRNNGISFCYTLLTKKNDSISETFIENAKKLIQTIKISNGI